jgi:hypothetical protein
VPIGATIDSGEPSGTMSTKVSLLSRMGYGWRVVISTVVSSIARTSATETR